MSRISEIRSVAYGNLIEMISEVEAEYFARRKEMIDLGGDWTREDLQEMLFEIFDSTGVLNYAVEETISGGME